ncbi:MAG: ABC transporter ATP-binding protein [Acidimicrobiales bacterium]
MPSPHETGPDTPPVVQADGLVKRWGSTTVFTDTSFTIGHGVTGLLGANGTGKTTIIGMLLGLHHADDGRLRVLGLDPTSAGPAVRARVGYAPEHNNLPPDIRAHDLVRHVAELHGLPRRDATARASDALWQVGLGEERFRAFGTMSTGQKQRVKLAQAIAHDPALVVLDEPTDGLDPVQRDDMLALIRRVGTDYGIDVVLSSHLLHEVEQICDAAVILGGGTVATSGTLGDLTAGSDGLLLDVDGDPGVVERVRDRLLATGATVDTDGPRLVVRAGTATGDLRDLARDAVVAEGAGIRRLSTRTTRLEDVFLEVS